MNKVCDKNRKAQVRMGEFSDLRLILYYLGQVMALQKGEEDKTGRFINDLAKGMMNG